MNIVEKVIIKGFWESREISIDFHKDINFFIGPNGSGKTTVINIIAAALTADFENILRLPFTSIKIHLREVGGRKRPTIELSKELSERSTYPKVVYSIKEKATAAPISFELDAYEEEMLARRTMARAANLNLRNTGRGLFEKLAEMVNVSWLSIHRVSVGPLRGRRDENFESSVDQKLEELSVSLAKYFSVLSSKVAEEIAEFQRNMIVSLITEQAEQTIFTSIQSLDLEDEKRSLVDIFSKLNIKGSARSKLDKHYIEVEKSRTAMRGGPIALSGVMTLVSAYRSHKVVQEWNALLKKQEEILQPRITFLAVLNSLYMRKKIEINQRNELEATTASGKKMPIKALSSGEKQLVIILGEALLQQKSAWIYITDEPELSLHVSWQEKLMDSLVKLNPRAQIICATHSPDVVSHYTNRIFSMQEMIE